jgi:hypothetical protein
MTNAQRKKREKRNRRNKVPATAHAIPSEVVVARGHRPQLPMTYHHGTNIVGPGASVG